MKPALRNVLDCGLLALPFLLVWLLVQRFGAYPANDDFVYARSVQLLLDDGRYVIVSLKGDVAPSALAHVVAGAAVCRWLGFAFESLRVVTLLLAWLGSAAMLAIARAVGCSRGIALLVATSLAVCPHYFGQAFTFMTDTPAVAWMAISLGAFWWGFRRNSILLVVLGSVFAMIGFLTRQTVLSVLVFPVVLQLAAMWVDRSSWRRRLLFVLAACAIPVIGSVIFELGIFGRGSAERLTPLLVREYGADWWLRTAKTAYGVSLLAGFWTLPLGPALCARLRDYFQSGARGARLGSLVGASIALFPVGGFLWSGGRAYLTNATGYFVQNAHFGPVILSDAYDPGRWGDMGGVSWPPLAWQALTLLSIMNLALIGGSVAGSIVVREDRDSGSFSGPVMTCAGWGMLLSGILAAFLLLAILEFTFDRYWMVLLAPMLGWIAVELRHTRRMSHATWCVSLMLLACVGWLSVVFTHDYAAWNRARWEIVEGWLAAGVPAEQMDGGYEINGWFRSAEDPATHPRPGDDISLWWSGYAERFLAVGPRPGFRIVESATWHAWATGRNHTVLGLRREPE